MNKGSKELSRAIALCLLMGITALTGVKNVYGQATVINIEAPNEDGISHNRHETFHVEKEGLILNNAIDKVTTKLSGVIGRNEKLNGKSAKVILAEIQGNNITHIKGALEVAGPSAAVIIANPKGIIVNGASFLNTKSVDLWAGKPVFDDGHLTKQVLVEGGHIFIGKEGMTAKNSDVRMVARTMNIDGIIKAKNIDIRTNQGIVDFKERRKGNKKSEQPKTRWIDISETGGMYAHTIYIQSEEDGTGFSSKGIMDGEDEIVITTNGDIEIKGTTLSKNTIIKTENNVELVGKDEHREENEDQGNTYPEEENIGKNFSKTDKNVLLWNIEKPDAYGISLNRTETLYVYKNGLLLNNSIKDSGSINGEYIKSNPNLKDKTATLIIAEVTGDNKTTIDGDIEIMGNKADLLIANPNGLVLRGGKAIHVGNLSFLTGKINYQNGITQFIVSQKHGIDLKDEGFDGSEGENLNVITHLLMFGASLNAKNLNVCMGNNISLSGIHSEKQDKNKTIPITLHDRNEMQIYTGNTGATIMDIATPDNYGISMNKTDTIFVSSLGFILNNAATDTNTKIGEVVKGNPNFMGQTAKLIIAEAEKDKATIGGTIEIAGKKADIIIVSPKGIEVHGGEVVNANRLTLLSGVIAREEGKVILFPNLEQMTFTKGEWNTQGVRQTNIMGNNITIDSHIRANHINLMGGISSVTDIQRMEILPKEIDNIAMTITNKGSMDGKNISIYSPSTQMNFIQSGELHGEKLLRIDMKGTILHQGYSRGLVTELITKGQMKNEGVVQGERVEVEADTLLNSGSLFAGDLRVKGKRIENTGESIDLWEEKEKVKELTKEIETISKRLEAGRKMVENPAIRWGQPELWEHIMNDLSREAEKLKPLQEQKESLEKEIAENEKRNVNDAGIMYGASAISLTAEYLYNQKGASMYSDGLFIIQGPSENNEDKNIKKYTKAKLIHNHGGSIYSSGQAKIYAETVKNSNADLRIKTIEGNWESDPDRIEIDAPGSEYNHVIATKDYFNRLEHRLNYDYIPYAKEKDKYPYFSQSFLEKFIVNREDTPDENKEEIEEWDNINDEGIEMLSSFGITRDEAEELEEAKLKELVESNIKEKYGKTLDEYEKMWKEYNKILTFANYWEIHSKHRRIETELLRSLPGSVVAEDNLWIDGRVENEDSLIQAGKRIDIKGQLQNKATVVTEKMEKEGSISHTQPHSYWHWGNHTRRAWSDYENYHEPDDEISYYLPTVTYTVDTESKNISAMTEGDIKAKQDGAYTITEENKGNNKNLVMTIHHDDTLQKKQVSSLITAKEIRIQGNKEIDKKTENIAGNNIENNAKPDIENEGTILANTLSISTNSFTNHGTMETKDMAIQAKDSIHQTGDMVAEKKIILDAGEIHIDTEKILAKKKNEKETAPGGIIVTGDKGLLYVHSQKDIHIKDQHIGAIGDTGTILLDADGQIILDTETYTKTIGTTESENNVRIETTDSGNVIEGDGDVTIQAKGDITVKASAVRSAKGHMRLLSGNDIHLTTGQNIMDAHYYWRHEQGGTGSKRGNHTSTEKKHERKPIVSEILGHTVTIVAKRDIHLLSANTINRKNTKIKAGRDIISSPDTTLSKTEYSKTFDGSGIGFGGGFLGIRIGSWNEKHDSTAEKEEAVPTTITSIHGTVDLDAEGKIHATTTYIYGRDGVTLTGANIILDGTTTKSRYTQTDAYQFDGLTIGIGGQTMHQLQDAYVFGNNAFKVRDKRLKLLEGKETIDTLKNIKDRWNKYEDKDLTLTVAVTHSKGKQSYDNLIIRHEGGGIGSEGNITLNLKDSKNGEVKFIGQTLKGKQIYVNTYNLTIDVGKTETYTNETNHNETIEVGGEIGKSGTFMPTIGYNEAKGKTEETHISYTPTVINGDHITIKAGGNIHIKGSQIAGKKINIEAKKNLTIESNQESYTYKNKNAGIGINVGVKTVSGEVTKGKINYKVDTVTEQAGIYAGDEGFTINVGEATNLKGAIIDSRAKDENKNTLTTNSIHTENIINEESLSNQDIGAGYHEGEGTKRNEEKLTPMIPISIDKNKKSITYAGIQKGKLIIKGNQNYNVDKVNRNTQDTLNALENTLDLKDIEEKKRLSELFAKYANGYVHDISHEKGWKEGSEEKVILHTIIGGITAKIGNGNYQAGAFSGAVNELMNGAIAKYEAKTGKAIDPATHQWLSVAVGAIVNQAAGMSMQTGAAEAGYGTKWNYWGEETITQNIKKVKDTIEETKYETGVLAMENAKKLIENGTVSFEGMPGDYYVGVISAGQGLKAASTAFILDRHGNVYANVSFAPGFITGVPFSCGSGWLGAWNGEKPKSSDDYKKLISGWSGSISIVAGVGGTIGVGRESVTGEFQAGADVNISGAFGYTFYVGNIKDAVTN